MSGHPPARLPGPVRELLDGAGLADRIGPTLLLVTTGDDGMPHLAVLSVGEVLATGGAEVRIALRRDSGSSEALRRTRLGLLVTVVDGALFRVQLSVSAAHDAAMASGERVALFAAEVRHVSEDRVHYARLLHGIEYELPEAGPVLDNWEEKLAMLRAM